MSEYTKSYPDRIMPQVRSPQPSEPMHCLTCPPNTELQAVIFNDTNLSVIKGWEWRSNIDLNDFFQPCENYAEYQLMIPALGTKTLSYGPIALTTGGVNFLMIFPQYHQTNIEIQSDWKMRWRFVGDTTWNGLGRILMLSGTEDYEIRPIEIENTAPADVELKILITV